MNLLNNIKSTLKLFASISLLIITANLSSQKTYNFPEKFNQYYNFKPDEAYNQLLKVNFKNDKSEIDRYAVTYFYREQFDFDYNRIYLDWSEYEVYLVKILNFLFPENINSKKLDIFIERSLVKNAGASGFGNIYFNLGLIKDAEDESLLAGIIAHEVAHIYFDHRNKKLQAQQEVTANGTVNHAKLTPFLKLNQQFEIQADSFALATLKKHNLNFESLLNYHDEIEMKHQVDNNSRSYSKLIKASNLDPNSFAKKKQKDKKPYDSHPSSVERIDAIKNSKSNCTSCSKKFFIDSLFFTKFKKISIEEGKKITFEKCQFDECIRISFKEYLLNPKNIKNIYYLVESIRRLIYSNPKISSTGFLTQNIDDSDLYYENKSILYKPDYIFETFQQYQQLKDHSFFVNKEKPFNTYSEALIYFSNQALKLNFNEANFSLGLYYFSMNKFDSCNKYLQNYLNNNQGLNKDLAQSLLSNKKTSISKGKTLTIYDNIGNYNLGVNSSYYGKYYYYISNYYQTKRKKIFNNEIKSILGKDSITNNLILLNEYLGSNPNKLYEMQKLRYSIFNLYNDDDIEMCKKVRLKSNYVNEKNEIDNSFKKDLAIFAPEWYNWMRENNYEKIFYVDVVYEYKGYTDESESYNTYTGYYINVNDDRPYFKDAVRIANNRKQKESEICKDLYSFLYE